MKTALDIVSWAIIFILGFVLLFKAQWDIGGGLILAGSFGLVKNLVG